MIKKLALFASLALLPFAVARAETFKTVQMSTSGALQGGTTSYAMHIGSGTVDNFRCATCTVTGPLSVTGLTTLGTATASSMTATNFTASAATITALNSTTIVGTNATLTNATITNPTLGNQTITGLTTFTSASTVTAAGSLDVSGVTAARLTAASWLSTLWNYRRPVLQFISRTQVSLSTNTGTANMRSILWPDGEVRNVTENTGAASPKYCAITLGNQAFWGSSSTIQSGVVGSTGTANTLYELLAVKISSVGLTTNFILAATTIEAIPANFATLNSLFGTNGWIPLGLLPNGNDDSVNTTMVQGWDNFIQRSDGWTILLSTFSGNTNIGGQGGLMGKLMATSASATSITYTTVRGTGSRQIPNVVDAVNWVGCHGTGSTNGFFLDVNSIRRYSNYSGVSGGDALPVHNGAPDDGLLFTYSTAGTGDVGLSGWHDSTLSGGPNSQF